jgi:hypothetical protein
VTDSDLVVVRTYSSGVEAELAMSALEAAGIHVLIRRDDAAGIQPALWVEGIDLLVRAEDAAAAAELLSIEAESQPGSDEAPA